MVALAEEVGLRVEAEAALAQDHPRVVLLGARPVAGLQGGQVGSVALAQELRRGQESGQRRRPASGPAPIPQRHPFSPSHGVSSFSAESAGNWALLPFKAPAPFGQLSPHVYLYLWGFRILWILDGDGTPILVTFTKIPNCKSLPPSIHLLPQGI